DLGEDVDAVLLLVDHLLQATCLPLDPAQPLQVGVLVADVSVVVGLRLGHSLVLQPSSYPPRVSVSPSGVDRSAQVSMCRQSDRSMDSHLSPGAVRKYWVDGCRVKLAQCRSEAT